MSYEMRFMDDAMKTEIDELLQGEHGKAITAFAFECGNTAVCGYKQACVRNTLLGVGGGLLIFGAVQVGKKIIPKFKRQYESKKYIEV